MKPSYVGTLNRIAQAEDGGGQIFRAWRDATSCAEIRPVLNMVMIREYEHSLAFEKRLCELGYALRVNKDQKAELKKTVEFFGSKASDGEKFKRLGVHKYKSASERPKDEKDPLLALLADRSIDPTTAGLLGRFIAEERDSGAELHAAYKSMPKAGRTASTQDVNALCAEIGRLKTKVRKLRSKLDKR